MGAVKIAVGKQVMVHTKVMYKQYELPVGTTGTVVNVDELGDCRVSWATIGPKWLLMQDLQRIHVQDAEGNWTACALPGDDKDGDDDLGCVEDERASPLKAEKASGRTFALLDFMPDPVRNLEGSFNGAEVPESMTLDFVVPEDVPREGHLPLGLVLDNTSGVTCVSEVRPDTWGARSGVLAGDVIVALDGTELKHASRQEVERLGKMRPLPMRLLRPAPGSASPGRRATVSDLTAKLRAFELRADAAEQRVKAAEQVQFSKQDLSQMLEVHRARAEEAEQRATDAEFRAGVLVARKNGRPEPQTSDIVGPKAVLIGIGPELPEAPLSVQNLSDEIALPVSDLVNESLPEPCFTCSSPTRL